MRSSNSNVNRQLLINMGKTFRNISFTKKKSKKDYTFNEENFKKYNHKNLNINKLPEE